jgi:PAS domain S-box-containing protein
MTSFSSSPNENPASQSRLGGASGPPLSSTSSMMAGYKQREQELWRLSMLLVVMLAVALGAVFWERLKFLEAELLLLPRLLPVGVVLVILVVVALVAKKKHEVDRLRAAIQIVQSARPGAPSEGGSEEVGARLLEIVTRSQQGYRALIDSFDDAVLALSLDGEILAANRRFAEILGNDFPRLIGHRLEEFISEPVPGDIAPGLDRFLERREWSGIIRFRLKNSARVQFFDCVLHAIVREGQVTGTSVLARDVTNQRESEARFAELFETLQEGIYFTTPDGRFLEANPALVSMLDYSSKEALLRLNVNDVYANPEERTALLAEIECQGHLRNREISLRRQDGSMILCLDNCSVVRDSAGKTMRYQGTLVDITSRREMETNLHREQEFARRLIESFPDVIVVIDDHGRFTYVSPRIRDVMGYAPEDLLGTVLGERSAPEERPSVLKFYESLIAGQQTSGTIQYRARHKDGTWRLIRGSACPLKDASGHITGVVASVRDVTEVDRLEHQVMQTEKLAAMGQMIAGVAHELNNPLTAILAVSDLLRERAAEPGDKRQLELMHQQARRAADIVQDLLAFSRPPAPQRANIRLGDVVRRALNLHEYSLRRNSVFVDLLPDSGIPEVVGDPNQLIQVFLNLVINAEQAIREARDQGTIRIRLGLTALPQPRVFVSFQDDGPGIPEDILLKIFDPFFTTKRPGRGTGLGLSICMAIVREHGGDIQVQAAPGGGTVFVVLLPPAPVLDSAVLMQHTTAQDPASSASADAQDAPISGAPTPKPSRVN